MPRRCQITGARTRFGNRVSRRGKAKREGGVGKKITGITRRTFRPNLQKKRIWVPELGIHVPVKLSTRALRTIDKKGAYRVLLDAGLVKPPPAKSRPAAGSNVAPSGGDAAAG